MKRILQTLDSVSSKKVEGASDMSKFVRIVKEAAMPPATPTAPAATAPAQPPVATAPANPQQDPNFAKYAELMAKYDMLSKEMIPDANGIAKNASASFIQQVANLKAQAEKLAGSNLQAWEKARKVSNTPAQTNQQLAKQLETQKTFKDYLQNIEEGLKDPKDNPCWKGYKPVGTKKKNGKTVPNCVPKE